MGVKNFLIDGVSCSGKTTVLRELRLRGHHTIDGDNELAYFDENRNWIWDIKKVRTLVADRGSPRLQSTASYPKVYRYLAGYL